MSKQKRVLLKLSGESISGSSGSGIDYESCRQIAERIQEVHAHGYELGIVIGGGNIFRGKLADSLHFERTDADKVGMVATSVNGLILSQMLRSLGVKSHVMGALQIETVVQKYDIHSARERLSSKEVVFFVGGTGNPYFTTDTAAALRACEVKADMLLKATKVDGVYDRDPMTDKEAKRFSELTYDDCLSLNLQIMDQTAFALCKEHSLPIRVFNLFEEGSILRAITNDENCTLVTGGTCQ